MTDVKRVLVVGAGTMGSQIALQTAMSGRYDVTLVDSVEGQLERARTQNTRLVDQEIESCLVCDEEGLGFPVRDGLPVLLASESFSTL